MLKSVNIFIFFFIMVVPVFPQTGDFRIMTYNIWYDNPNNTENPWSERKTGVLETLDRLHPDIFCIQEALDHQVHDLKTGTYNSFGVGRDDGKHAGEYAAIFYDTLRLELLDGGNFWLSETPDSAGTPGWDAACVRIVSWVKLSERKTYKIFFVFNTHFDHIGVKAREESAKLLVDRIEKIGKTAPVLLTGDFNCKPNSTPYSIIINKKSYKPMTDARSIASKNPTLPDYTYVGNDFSGKAGEIIDYIFVSKKIKLINYSIEENCQEGKCPSDHLPVIVDFKL